MKIMLIYGLITFLAQEKLKVRSIKKESLHLIYKNLFLSDDNTQEESSNCSGG